MMGRDRRARAGLGAAMAATLLVALGSGVREAQAATVCGTLITNVAAAGMSSGFPDFVAYEVSYNATATVMVLCSPVVALRKFANGGLVTEAAAGATVTFSICIENQTVDTVWGVSVTDRLPDSMVFVDEGVGGKYDMTNPVIPPPAVPLVNAATVAGLTAGTAGAPVGGQGAPHYMRWTYTGIGPQKSACAVYRARIL